MDNCNYLRADYVDIPEVEVHTEVGDGFTTISCTYGEPCKHENGWYQTIPWWFWRKSVYVCIDCLSILDMNKERFV